MSPLVLLPALALAALVSLAAAGLLLVAGHGAPQLAAHLAFALGIVPLILAAMSYFIPVLTRSAAAGFGVWWPPLLAWSGGVLAVYAFAGDVSPAMLSLAATLAGVAAAGIGGWALLRVRRMFGPRHRGLDWYLAALGFLLLAVLAIVLMPLYPEQRNALRLFHLHANLLGFVGLTALGTLQVLMPTCVGRPDPDAAVRLRRDLKWAVGGVLLISLGAAVALRAGAMLTVLGAALYGWVVCSMLLGWLRGFGKDLVRTDGAAPSLAAAALGLLSLLALGLAHGAGWVPARPAVAGYVIAFLLPLVSGAAAHLMPVWLRPGVQNEWHATLRARLCRWGGVRGLILLFLGLALTAAT
jgi:hypothetical protein